MSSPVFPPPPSCPCVVQATHQWMVGTEKYLKAWNDLSGCLGSVKKEPFLSLFLWIDSCLAPSPLYPASGYSINKSAVWKEETSFPVKCEEEGEVLKSCWKKTKLLFSYCRCHLHLLAVVKASRLGPWIFCFHIPLLKCEPSLMRGTQETGVLSSFRIKHLWARSGTCLILP